MVKGSTMYPAICFEPITPNCTVEYTLFVKMWYIVVATGSRDQQQWPSAAGRSHISPQTARHCSESHVICHCGDE